MKKLSILFVIVSLLSALTVGISGCSCLDILGVGVADEMTNSTSNNANKDTGDFLKTEDVIAFFNESPGEELNKITDFAKAVINSAYVDEINLKSASNSISDEAWRVVSSVMNDFASKDDEISYNKKKMSYVISEEHAKMYVKSCFAAINDKTAKKVLEKFNENSTMISYDEKKSEYTVLSAAPAQFNASLINVKIKKGVISINGAPADGAELSYQLTDVTDNNTSLGKVKMILIKNVESKFGYSIAKLSYIKKGLGKKLVPDETAAPEAANPTSK